MSVVVFRPPKFEDKEHDDIPTRLGPFSRTLVRSYYFQHIPLRRDQIWRNRVSQSTSIQRGTPWRDRPVTFGKDEHEPIGRPVLQFGISDLARDFVQSELSPADVPRLFSLMSEISGFLRTRGPDNTERLDLFTDQEFNDWQELRLILTIKGLPATNRSKIKTEVYEMVERALPESLLDKLIISFEFS